MTPIHEHGPAARRITRADFLRAGAVVLGGLSVEGLAACGGSSTKGLTLRTAGGDSGYPSPFAYVRGPGYWRMTYLFDTLIWKDETGKLIPWLATSWSTPDSGHSWRFRLRGNVRWQDGRALTARDVAFTFEYFKGIVLPPTVVARPEFVARVRAVNDHEVDFELAKPYAGFLEQIAGALPIVPQHVWGSVTEPAKLRGAKAAMGSGPYRLGSYSPAAGTYLFTANDSYFLGRPYVRRLENPNVGDELLAVRGGDLDAGGPPLGRPSKAAVDSFRSNPAFGVIQGAPDFTQALYFGLTKGGPLADARFRRAIASAINLPDIVNRALQGAGLPGNPGFLPPSSPWYVSVPGYPFDLAKARAELDAAGYRMVGGARRGPDGKPLVFQLSFASPISTRPAELLISYLAPLGITVQPRSVDEATLFSSLVSGDYQMALIYYGGLGGDPDYMRRIFAGKLPLVQVVRGYQNPEFQRLALSQAFTTDQAARHKLVARLQQLLAIDVPVLSLYYPYFYWVYRKRAFDPWYFTPGGFGIGVPTIYNKQVFVTGRMTGTAIRPSKA